VAVEHCLRGLPAQMLIERVIGEKDEYRVRKSEEVFEVSDHVIELFVSILQFVQFVKDYGGAGKATHRVEFGVTIRLQRTQQRLKVALHSLQRVVILVRELRLTRSSGTGLPRSFGGDGPGH